MARFLLRIGAYGSKTAPSLARLRIGKEVLFWSDAGEAADHPRNGRGGTDWVGGVPAFQLSGRQNSWTGQQPAGGFFWASGRYSLEPETPAKYHTGLHASRARYSEPDRHSRFGAPNKVYGDSPNSIRLKESPTRWDYDDPDYEHGIPESLTIDQSTHSLFGASKLTADLMTQEYGRYFGMPACCLRGGCVTGPSQSGVELHGFLSYLVKCNVEQREYKVFGYKGKQVRDNIHSADVAHFVYEFCSAPTLRRCVQFGWRKKQQLFYSRSVRTDYDLFREQAVVLVPGPASYRRPYLLLQRS